MSMRLSKPAATVATIAWIWILVCRICQPATAAASVAAVKPAGGRPNVVLLFADDMRADAIGAWGNPHVRTPNIDALTRGGVSFRNAHIMGAQIGAVCVPSRAMLLTGRSLFRLEKNGQVIPPAHATYPELLRKAGYETFAAGKWHNDRPSFARSFSGAASVFFGGMSEQTKIAVHPFDPQGEYAGNGKAEEGKYSSELFADEAVRFLAGRKADPRPFYLHLAFTVPHDPRKEPPGYEGKYDAEKLPLPDNFLPRHPFDSGELKGRDEELSERPLKPEYVKRELAAYYAMIEHMDAQVGRVLAALKESGREQQTLVIFAADNGLALGSHGLLGKQNLYEHSVRVPLIVKGPGAAAGRNTDALCFLLDLFPTVCEWTGTDTPPNDGRSLLPVIRGQKESARDGLFFAYRAQQRAYRDARYKLIEYDVKGERTTQLFDLAEDPSETRNLAPAAEHAKALARMRDALADAQRANGDPLAAGRPQ
jgi:arylsulfatase A-like enzyme